MAEREYNLVFRFSCSGFSDHLQGHLHFDPLNEFLKFIIFAVLDELLLLFSLWLVHISTGPPTFKFETHNRLEDGIVVNLPTLAAIGIKPGITTLLLSVRIAPRPPW